MSGCCPSEEKKQVDSCHSPKKRDWFFLICLGLIILSYCIYPFRNLIEPYSPATAHFFHSNFELMNTMWWGVGLGIIFVGLLGFIPRELVISIIGDPKSAKGVIRATVAGVLLDLCNHGVVMIGMKLYERGASLAQVFAFLIASPWNSMSLTFVMIALIGLPLTLGFIVLSTIIAIFSGLIVLELSKRNKIPSNPYSFSMPENYNWKSELKKVYTGKWRSVSFYIEVIKAGILDSKMILKWIFFGAILTSIVRVFVDAENFEQYLGPTLAGLSITIFVATILEVCSEGSTPLAADLIHRGKAPGNAFAFLMTGVATDYTEIMAIKETTKSFKLAFLMPLITVPQIILLGVLLNHYL